MTDTLYTTWMLALVASAGSGFSAGLSGIQIPDGLVNGWIAGKPAA